MSLCGWGEAAPARGPARPIMEAELRDILREVLAGEGAVWKSRSPADEAEV